MEAVNDSYLQILEKTFSKYYPLSSTSLRSVFEQCTIKTYLQNEIVASEGRMDGYEYFLLNGIFHSYSVSPEGELITTKIFAPQSVITPHIVRTSSGKNIQTLACLQDAVAAIIPMSRFSLLMNEHADIRAFGYKVVEAELALTTRREVSLLTLSAKERLLNFRKDYPNFENLVPHSVIAGFLGITPVSFSRLRKELASAKS